MSVEISVSGSCNNASNVVDVSPDTRASSKGLGSYLDATLKEKKKVKGLAIAFFAGDKRKIKFTVASDNKLVQTFASSGNTSAPEEFFFDKPITTQSLRVSFAGNYKKEVTFDKEALSTLPCGNPNFVDGIAVAGTVKANVGIDDGSAGNDWFTVTRLAVIVDDSPDVDLDENNVVTNLNDKTSTVKPDSNEPKKKEELKIDNSNKQKQQKDKDDEEKEEIKPKSFQITGTPELKATGTGSQSKVVINNKDNKTNS